LHAPEAAVKWKRTLLYATAILTFISIPFTYSRGALLGLAVVVPGVFPRLKKLFIVLPLLIPLAFLARDYLPEKLVQRAQTIETYDEDNSAMQRLRWAVAIGIAMRPLERRIRLRGTTRSFPLVVMFHRLFGWHEDTRCNQHTSARAARFCWVAMFSCC
jgi:hypothetical protein